MTPQDVLLDCSRLGIVLAVDGDRLRYRPASAVTPELGDGLRANKAELLGRLRNELFNTCQVQGGTKDGAFRQVGLAVGGAGGRNANVQPAFDKPSEFRMADFKAVAAGQQHDKRAEGATGKQILNGVDHASSLAIPTAAINESAPLGPDGWPADCIDPKTMTPCPTCGTLELWQAMTGDWRCLKCDHSPTAWKAAEAVERIKDREQRRGRR